MRSLWSRFKRRFTRRCAHCEYLAATQAHTVWYTPDGYVDVFGDGSVTVRVSQA